MTPLPPLLNLLLPLCVLIAAFISIAWLESVFSFLAIVCQEVVRDCQLLQFELFPSQYLSKWWSKNLAIHNTPSESC